MSLCCSILAIIPEFSSLRLVNNFHLLSTNVWCPCVKSYLRPSQIIRNEQFAFYLFAAFSISGELDELFLVNVSASLPLSFEWNMFLTIMLLFVFTVYCLLLLDGWFRENFACMPCKLVSSAAQIGIVANWDLYGKNMKRPFNGQNAINACFREI